MGVKVFIKQLLHISLAKAMKLDPEMQCRRDKVVNGNYSVHKTVPSYFFGKSLETWPWHAISQQCNFRGAV